MSSPTYATRPQRLAAQAAEKAIAGRSKARAEPRLWSREERGSNAEPANGARLEPAALQALAEAAKRQGLEQRRPEDFENEEMEGRITRCQQRLLLIDDLIEVLDKQGRLAPELTNELRGQLASERSASESELELHTRAYEQWQQNALIAYYQSGEEPDPDQVIPDAGAYPPRMPGMFDWLFGR
jgi:hypothetical protein